MIMVCKSLLARLSGKKQMKPYTQFEDWHLEKLASPSEAMGSIEKLGEKTNLTAIAFLRD
jgi:hypothetical protein